jgi:hypothetical protein
LIQSAAFFVHWLNFFFVDQSILWSFINLQDIFEYIDWLIDWLVFNANFLHAW